MAKMRISAHWTGHAVAVAGTAASLLLRWALDPYLGESSPYTFFYIPILLAAYLGGWAPGCLALLLSTITATVLFVAPRGSLLIELPHNYFGLTIFLPNGALVIWLATWARRVRQTAFREARRAGQTLESMSDVYLLLSRNWKIMDMNREAERVLSRSRGELIGRNAWDAFPQSEEFRAHYERALATGQNQRFEAVCVPLGKCFEISTYPTDEGLALFFRDITERQAAEAGLQQARALLTTISAATPDLIFAKDLEGRYLYVNDGWSRAVGVPRDQTLGRSDTEVFGDTAFARIFMANDRRVMDSGVAETVEEGTPDGRRLYLVTKSPMRDAQGKVEGLVGVGLDVTERKRLEEELRERERELAASQEAAHVGNWSWDLVHDRFTHSDEMCRISGIDPETFGGDLASVKATIHPDDVCMLDQATADLLAGKPVEEFEYRTNRPDGTQRIVRALKAQLERDSQGRPIRISGVVIDVTEQRQAEETLRVTQSAVDSAADAVFWMNSEGRFVYVNDRACESLGYSREELLSMTVFDIDPVYPRDRWQQGWQEVTERGSVFLESQHRRKNGEVFPVEISARHVRYRDQDYHFAFVRDITVRKRHELQLALAKVQAEAANTAKDQFLAALSHELRTPLTPVLMLSQLLARDDSLPELVREDLKTIRQNVLLETRLIDDLLDLTRIARGKIQLKPEIVDLHALLQHAAQTCCDEEFANKRLRLQWNLGARLCTVWADPPRLEQVFWNVIRNAIKFTPAEGRITIRTANLDGGLVRVEVADTGIGIEADRLATVFDVFEQGGIDIGRRFGGLGLGLAICRAIMDLHKGRIEAASDGCGLGATFAVTLPVAAGVPDAAIDGDEGPAAGGHAPAASGMASATSGDVPATGGSAPAAPARILLVEDHGPTATVLQRLMKRWGWEVQRADSVRAGVELAARNRFEFVVSDLGLPDGSGHDLMRHLRDTYGLSGIAVSGYGADSDVKKSLAAGFVGHLTKPVDFEELRNKVNSFVAADHSE